MKANKRLLLVNKVNDGGKVQPREILLEGGMLKIIQKKNKVKRELYYQDITRISFTFNSETPEFLIHNKFGDLRFSHNKDSCDPTYDLILNLRHLKDFFEDWNKYHDIGFYSLDVEILELYHNKKKSYKKRK